MALGRNTRCTNPHVSTRQRLWSDHWLEEAKKGSRRRLYQSLASGSQEEGGAPGKGADQGQEQSTKGERNASPAEFNLNTGLTCFPPAYLPDLPLQGLPTLLYHSRSSAPMPELQKLLDQGAPPAQVILTRYGAQGKENKAKWLG